MRFVIPRPDLVAAGATEQAYLAGPEGIPWECRTTLVEGALLIERDTRESGYLYFPWIVTGRGLVQLCSGSLMERAKAYNLPVELARGTLNRLRNQVWAWQASGMTIPAAFSESLHAATAAFSRAATAQGDLPNSHAHADEAIRLGLEAIDILVREYAQQVLTIRRTQQGPLGTLLAARLQERLQGDAQARFLAACNTALVGIHWPDLEPQEGVLHWDQTDRLVAWCQENSVRLCLGPLLRMDKHSLPDWLFLEEGYDEVQAAVLSLIDAVVKRYRGKVQLWHVAARMNQDGAFSYSEEQRLRLVVEAVDRLRGIDQRTPIVVSFDQPWGEYIARKDQELTPLHFADTLVRGELGLAGIGLEINYGYWPGGTLPRDGLEISRQLDRWSQLGVPLMVFLSAPSSPVADSLARHPAQPLAGLCPGGASPDWQGLVVQSLLPILLAKQNVQAVGWDAWQDDLPHEMPASGLVGSDGKPKSSLQTFTQLKRDWIG
jgi:hypothetical protein